MLNPRQPMLDMASVRGRRAGGTRGRKHAHVLGHGRTGSVAVCGSTLDEEIICGDERVENENMVSKDVRIDDIAWIAQVRNVPC